VLLGHDLFALHLAILEPIAAGVGAFGPLAHLPADGAIEDIAVLAIRRRGLGTHAIRDHHGVVAATGHLMNALHLAGLDSNAAALGAGRVVRVVPSGRAGTVVAGANPCLGFGFGCAEKGGHHPSIVLAHAIDDQLLDASKAGGTAGCVALLPPHIRLSRLRNTHFNRIPRVLLVKMMRGRHARLLGTSLHLVMGLLSLAKGVIHGGHCSRVFQEYLAVVGPPAD